MDHDRTMDFAESFHDPASKLAAELLCGKTIDELEKERVTAVLFAHERALGVSIVFLRVAVSIFKSFVPEPTFGHRRAFMDLAESCWGDDDEKPQEGSAQN